MSKIREGDVVLSLLKNPVTEALSVKAIAEHAGVSDKTISRMIKNNRLPKFRVSLNYPLLRVFTLLVYCESSIQLDEEDFKGIPFVEEVYVTDSFKNEYFIKMKVLKYNMIFPALKKLRELVAADYFVTNIAYDYLYDTLLPQDSRYFDVKREHLDEKDWKVLSALNENPLRPINEIASEIRIPVQTVSYRINKMGSKNIILGYPVFPEPSVIEQAGLRTYLYLARRWDPINFDPEVINVSMHYFHAGYNIGGVVFAKSSAVLKKGLKGSDRAVVFKIKDIIQNNWMEGLWDERNKRG